MKIRLLALLIFHAIQAVHSQEVEIKYTIVEGDILVPVDDGTHHSAMEQFEWGGGKVAYKISSTFEQSKKDQILGAMREIEEKTCIRFLPASPNQRAYIYIDKRFDGCHSEIGRTGRPQLLNLQDSCFERRTILHELMHALGFIHEHNRSDRDDYVTVVLDNVKERYKGQFMKRRFSELSLMNTPYSYESIMHYRSNAFAIDPNRPTIIPKRTGAIMGGGDHLSDIDVKRLNMYYKCAERPTTPPSTVPPPPSPPTPPPTAIECTNNNPVENGLCLWNGGLWITAPDSSSEHHFFLCTYANGVHDPKCGRWTRLPCLFGKKYNDHLKICIFWPW